MLSDEALAAAHITKGRATDDAPKGTRMIHAGLTSHIDELGVLPLFGHSIDGNQNGRTGIREQLALIRKVLKPQKFTMISDRGTFSIAHLLRLKNAKSHAICSVPWADVKDLFHKQRLALKWRHHGDSALELQQQTEIRHSSTDRYGDPPPDSVPVGICPQADLGPRTCATRRS
ncbi:MAG: hypothetical protein RIK87_27510 [Fuerstiella sp.]